MKPKEKASRSSLLRRSEQAVIGGLTLAGLLAMGFYWIAHGGIQGRLIDIDRAPRLQAQFQVDINEAPWPEFAQLPEVGETLAKRIAASRDEEGPFLDHSDLQRVQGIGPKTLARIKPYLRPIPEGSNVAGR